MDHFVSTLLITTASPKNNDLPKNFKIIEGTGSILVQSENGLPYYVYTYICKNKKFENDSENKSISSSLKISVYQISPYKEFKTFSISKLIDQPQFLLFSPDGEFLLVMFREYIGLFDKTKFISRLNGEYESMKKCGDGIIVKDHKSNIKIFKRRGDAENIEILETNTFEHYFKEVFRFIGSNAFITHYYMLYSNKNILYLLIDDVLRAKLEFPSSILQIIGNTILNKIYCLCNDNNIYISYAGSKPKINNISLLNSDKGHNSYDSKLKIYNSDSDLKIKKILLSFCEKYLYVVFKNFIHTYDTRFDNFIDCYEINDISDVEVILGGEIRQKESYLNLTEILTSNQNK